MDMDSSAADDLEFDQDEIRALHERLLSLARRLVGPSDGPEDLVQEAWVASLKGGGQAEERRRSWMNGVMRNIASTRRIRDRRRRDLEVYAWEDAEVVTSSAGASEAAEVLRSAVAALGEPYATVLSRRFFDGASVEEIANERGATASTVRSQLSRGLERLRGSMDVKYGGREAWAGLLVPLGALHPAGAPTASTWSLGSMWLLVVFLVAGIGTWALFQAGDDDPVANGVLADVAAMESAVDTVAAIEDASSRQGARVDLRTATDDPVTDPLSQEELEPAVAVSVLDLMIDVQDESGLPEPAFSLRIQGPGSSERRVDSESTPTRVSFIESDVRESGDDRFLLLTAEVPGSAPSLRAHVSLDVLPGTKVEFRTRGKAGAGEIFVKDPDGNPIAGAVVTLDAAGQETTPSDIPGVTFTVQQVVLESGADGIAAFGQEPRTPRRMRVRASGFSTLDEVREISGDETRIVAALQVAGTVRGTVWLPGGAPAVGAAVRIVDPLRTQLGLVLPTITTEEDGTFELGDLRRQPEYISATLETDGQALFAYTIVNAAEAQHNTWEAQLEPHDGIRFRFVTEGGSPLAGHRAFLVLERATFEWGELLTTDADGVAICRYVPNLAMLVAFERGPNDLVPIARNTLPSDHAGKTFEVVVPVAPHLAASLVGTIQGPNGVPEASYLTGFQDDFRLVNVGIDGVTGAFRADSVPPGHYTWFAVVPNHGALGLGELPMDAGAVSDLGVIEIPPLVDVRIDWKGRRPSAEQPWVLELELSHESYDPLALRTIEGPLTRLELLPSRYVLRQEGGSAKLSFEVIEEERAISIVIQ